MATSLSVHSLFSSTRSIIYFSFLFDSIFHFVCLLASDVDVHLELGMQLLMKGQLNDALSHYHLAVESDSSNYLTYFKRSTVYQAMNRHKSALDDLNECLKLNENFLPARLQKATILYRQAVFDQALKEIEFILQMDPFNDDARLFHTNLDIMRNEENQAKQLIEWKRFSEAIPILDRLNQEHFLGYRFRELRALCYENIGDIINAINDLRAVTKMKSDDTDGYYKLSQLHYSLGEPEESLNAIRECLKLDPDHKECHKYYKKVKKLANFYKTGHEYASQHNYPDCIAKLESGLELEKDTPNMVLLLKSKLCHCLNMNKESHKAIKICSEAIELNPNDPNTLCDIADAYIDLEDYDQAYDYYKKAHQIDQTMTRPKDGYNKAERLKKQSQKRDYYKILGVSRNANKKDIMRAYRKAASKWHPDQFQGDEKAKAEKKFIDIAAAKEVLTDPEKRSKFDNGEDPLDHEQQNGNAFHSFFTNGFDPFGSGGNVRFTFRYAY
ncbi:hypothetical protein NH340_JMT06387 [Sarcoptes scabiei]|nr:hypothetical protein NH340_JMT06387 [Sarcoptes scabiei]